MSSLLVIKPHNSAPRRTLRETDIKPTAPPQWLARQEKTGLWKIWAASWSYRESFCMFPGICIIAHLDSRVCKAALPLCCRCSSDTGGAVGAPSRPLGASSCCLHGTAEAQGRGTPTSRGPSPLWLLLYPRGQNLSSFDQLQQGYPGTGRPLLTTLQ